MDTSSLIVAVMPVTTLIALFTGIALPFIAASRSGRSHAGGPPARADARNRTGAAGPKTRPPEPGADDAAPAGYLYVPCARNSRNGHPAQTRRWVQQVPIVKKTAKLIYYASDSWDRREAVVSPGCISREQFETDTRCRHDCPRDLAGLVCARHGRGHRHCVHVLAPGRHCHAPGGCGHDCPADTRSVQCARHGYAWEHCPHGQDRCRHGYPAGVIPVPGDRHRSGPAAGSSSPPARPPQTTCTARTASEPDGPHRKHHPSSGCAAPWLTLTPTAAARPSSSSKRAAGTRRRLGPRDGNVLTWPAPADTTALREEQMMVPAKECPPVTGWDHAAVGRRTTCRTSPSSAMTPAGRSDGALRRLRGPNWENLASRAR